MPTDDEMGGASDRAWKWVALALVFVVVSPVAAALARSASGKTLVILIVVQRHSNRSGVPDSAGATGHRQPQRSDR